MQIIAHKQKKENIVIELANEGKTTRDIAKEVHISLKDIGMIITKVTGDDDRSGEKESMEEKKQKWLKSLLYYAQAFQRFKDGKSLVDVAIEIDQESITVLNYYRDYLRLTRMKGLIVASMCQLKDDFLLFICLYQSKERGHEPMEYHSIGEKLTAAQRFYMLLPIQNASQNH